MTLLEHAKLAATRQRSPRAGKKKGRHGQPDVEFWVDAGMLDGRNPSHKGVFWSVYRAAGGAPGNIVIRRRSTTHYLTNNQGEWLALRAGLRYAVKCHKGQRIRLYSDSRLIVNQFNGRWRCVDRRLVSLRGACLLLARRFPACEVQWRPRQEMVERLGH